MTLQKGQYIIKEECCINFITLPTIGKCQIKWLEMASGTTYENLYVDEDFSERIRHDRFVSIYLNDDPLSLTEIVINSNFIVSFE